MLFDQNATSSRASSNRIVGIVDGFFLSAVQQFRHWRHFCSMIDLRFRPNTHKSRHYEWVGYSNEQWQAACKCSTSLMRLMIETVISVFRSFSVFHFLSISVWLTYVICMRSHRHIGYLLILKFSAYLIIIFDMLHNFRQYLKVLVTEIVIIIAHFTLFNFHLMMFCLAVSALCCLLAQMTKRMNIVPIPNRYGGGVGGRCLHLIAQCTHYKHFL